eukprot:3735112-Rhodomonas_salina.1
MAIEGDTWTGSEILTLVVLGNWINPTATNETRYSPNKQMKLSIVKSLHVVIARSTAVVPGHRKGVAREHPERPSLAKSVAVIVIPLILVKILPASSVTTNEGCISNGLPPVPVSDGQDLLTSRVGKPDTSKVPVSRTMASLAMLWLAHVASTPPRITGQ